MLYCRFLSVVRFDGDAVYLCMYGVVFGVVVVNPPLCNSSLSGFMVRGCLS